MRTKKIDITEYWDEPATVTIKRLGFGQQNTLLDQISRITVKGQDIESSPLYGELRTLVVLKCLVEAPFPITEEFIRDELDMQLGQFIFEEIDKFNTFKKEKNDLSEVAGKE